MRGTRRAIAVAAWGVLLASTALARIHHPAPETAPAAYLVVDADTGTVLAERDAHRRWPPASMTKMMTVLLAMERVQDGSLSLDTPEHTSAWASRIGGSQVYLAAGETFPLGEMLKAIMIASANDAAVAVAEHIAGSSAAFVELMNARAKALGLADTTYQSPHGLPPAKGQTADITSAHDLAVLGRERGTGCRRHRRPCEGARDRRPPAAREAGRGPRNRRRSARAAAAAGAGQSESATR